VTYDYLIVGAGCAGSVLAERLATAAGCRVLLIDRRTHLGGNAFDYVDSAGILVHRYGPHIFHTNSLEVVEYLSQFTAWRPYQHRVLTWVDGQLLPMPINLDTINRLYATQLTSFQVAEFPDVAEGAKELIGANKKITSRQRIRIKFDYPLKNATILTFRSKNGFTLKNFFQCVFMGYTRIYKDEGANPGMIPGMLNRASSNGKYGIWGHVMEDLYLEGATEVRPGKFELSMGS